MAHPILLPKQGITVESCVITQWRKRIGDSVAPGEVLFTYETDKSAFDVEAEAGGTLLDIFFPEGEDIPVLTVVGAIGAPGEDASPLRPGGDGAAASAAPSPSVSAAAAREAPEPSPMKSGVGISPRARATAAMLGVDPAEVRGTGPDGRIIERDVRAAFGQGASAQTAPPVAPAIPAAQAAPNCGYTEEKLSGVRRAIARGMTSSLQTMAQLTLTSSFDATDILAHRKAYKASPDPQIAGITLTDMVLFAVSRALTRPEHRALNAHLLDDRMRYFSDVHLACAVDTPRGLLVPTIFGAHRLTLRALSAELKRLAGLCQSGSVPPDLLAGATFTVSNLGGLGIEHFTPVINPPQTGILGLNNIVWRPRDASGALYPAMGLSVTFDHRALDGAPAARFLSAVGGMLGNFSALLAG